MTNSVKSVEANRPKISAQARPEKIGSMAMGAAPSIQDWQGAHGYATWMV